VANFRVQERPPFRNDDRSSRLTIVRHGYFPLAGSHVVKYVIPKFFGEKCWPPRTTLSSSLSAVKLESIPDLRRALYCAISVLLILGVFWSVRMAWADADAAQQDPLTVARACQLVPGAANYWLKGAAVREIDQPTDPAIDVNLDRALALNPRSTEAWIARAVRDEIRGRTADAERDYLAAARMDHMYRPAWALANFYARQEVSPIQSEKFWFYARKCLEVVEPRRLEPASYDPGPVFDLAWRVTGNPDEIRRKLLPPRHFILVDYLDYLAGHNLPDAGADVAMDLVPYGDPGDNYFLLNFCERLINLARGKRAMDIWNAMLDRGTVHAERLDPAHGRSLNNGDLKRPLERVGFDWRLPPAEGVAQSHFPDTGEVRFEFGGDQPDGVLTMYQSIPVVPGGVYRLTFRYRTVGLEHADGLSWQLWDYAGQRPVPVDCKLTAHQDWTAGHADFVVPKGVSIARLGIEYGRAHGSTTIRGTAAFSTISLNLVSAAGERQ
jgi:hypothetical protein